MTEETIRPDLAGQRVGVIGLGLMGKPMARALAQLQVKRRRHS